MSFTANVEECEDLTGRYRPGTTFGPSAIPIDPTIFLVTADADTDWVIVIGDDGTIGIVRRDDYERAIARRH